ncbi:MAG: capsular polysaccharide biosynthesis protein [Planctomycetota bacterium]|jgi:capsular polysaccharide biosynthesis protein
MAVEVESNSQVEEFVGLLKRRLLWIIHPALLMVSIGVSVAVIIPKKYVTETKVLVRDTSSTGGGPAHMSSDTTGEAKMADHQIRSINRIHSVLLDLGWPEFMEISRSEKLDFVKKVRENVKVDVPSTPGSGQVIVSAKFAHTDPQRAFDFLTKLIDAWKSEVLEQGINAETSAFYELKQRKLNLEKDRENLTDQITARLKEYHIPVSAPTQRGRGGEVQAPVFDKLADSQAELDDLLLEIQKLETKLAADREQFNRLPEMVAVPEPEGKDVTALKIEKARESILTLQQERREKGYKPSHSRYQTITDKIESYEQEIRILEEAPMAEVATVELTSNKARLRLYESIEKEESLLNQMHTQRDALSSAIDDAKAESAELQEVYAEIETWKSQRDQLETELNSVAQLASQKQQTVQWVEGPGGDPFEVLEDVELPTQPSEPNPTLIVLIFLFLGCGLGMGLALLGELTKNCFRTVGDVGRVMFVPVLGTINAIETRGQKMRRMSIRILASSVSLGAVGLFGFITWAWTARPELLSDRVLNAIDGFRQNFL